MSGCAPRLALIERFRAMYSGLFLLGALKGLQLLVVFLVHFLLVIKVKHIVSFNGDHLSIVDGSVVVCVKDSDELL